MWRFVLKLVLVCQWDLRKKMNLNKEDVLLLIQEYQKQRILWDPKDKWHFNQKQKNDAWEEIARGIDIDVEDAKKKISSLS